MCAEKSESDNKQDMTRAGPADPQIDQSKRTLLSYWWVLPVAGTVGTFGYMAHYASNVTFGKTAPHAPAYVPAPKQQVALISQFSGPYSFSEFGYAEVPCVVMELPKPSPSSLNVNGRHFAAFSRLCTHQGCMVNPVLDTELMALSYNYRPEHPMLGCPCHFSVFDPQSEGASVFGRALYPLPRVQLQAQGDALYAVGIEADPRQRRT